MFVLEGEQLVHDQKISLLDPGQLWLISSVIAVVAADLPSPFLSSQAPPVQLSQQSQGSLWTSVHREKYRHIQSQHRHQKTTRKCKIFDINYSASRFFIHHQGILQEVQKIAADKVLTK